MSDDKVLRFGVGDVVRVTLPCRGNPRGSLAFCYRTHDVWLLFPNGGCEGFTEAESAVFGLELAGHVSELANYRFVGFRQLDDDYLAGVFSRALTRDGRW